MEYKMYLYLFCSCLLWTLSTKYFDAIAQQGWISQTPKPQGSHLLSVCYRNENDIWTVGNNGVVLNSTDSGYNWNLSTINPKCNFFRIQFVNENFGIICGREREYEPSALIKEYGIILTTADAGISWTKKFKVSDLLQDAFFFDQMNGWAAADSGKVFKTTDGGNSWIKYYCGANVWLQEIYFSDLLNGWCVGYGSGGGVYKSTDGGATWINVTPLYQAYFHSLNFINKSTGWVCGTEIFKTTDAGVTWQQLTTSGGMESFSDIYFIDENVGWLLWSSSFPNPITSISKSTDGGLNWSAQKDSVNTSNLEFTNANLGCAVGSWGTIETTLDGGENWALKTEWLSFSLNKVDFPSLEIGFVTARKGSGTSATFYVLKTTDSGSNWIISDSTTDSWFLDLDFVNESTGWIVGVNYLTYEGTIRRTTDNGNTWVNQYSFPGHGISSIQFINNYYGWASVGGNNGELLFTTNAGENWNIVSTGYSFNPAKICFINLDVGWVIGYSSNAARIIKTTDGAQSWIDVSPQNLPDLLYDIDFINEQTGYVVGEHGIVIKTTDGGNIWNQISPDPWPLGPAFTSIQFVNENYGWILTDEIYNSLGSSLFCTTDGGSSWDLQAFLPGTRSSIFIYDLNTGWYVAGNNIAGEPTIGFVYKTTNGGSTFIESNNFTNQFPNNFLLFQNFPNPFNPRTVISYQLPVSSNIKLKVFDVLGNEIATLVDEYKSAGSYEVEWDASVFPSGVYFYQLQSGNFNEAKKMILMK
ncbi:MAG: YCF48-related protein [Ignavibacterium sp.]|jgi:photosystem II stability/assembly factor-like uncharacterized protein|nr:YCF48-related protein [Ignavibacterium sp.]